MTVASQLDQELADHASRHSSICHCEPHTRRMNEIIFDGHAALSRDLLTQADAVDAFAEKVEAWGRGSRDAESALGMIIQSGKLAERGARLLANRLIGPKTHASHRNDLSIALGEDREATSQVSYAIVYSFYQTAKYGPTDLSNLDVKASSLRIYAAGCRVVAHIARQVAAGEYRRIG